LGEKGSLSQHELRHILTKAYQLGKEQKDLSLLDLKNYLEKELHPYFGMTIKEKLKR
jgi:hypothetical protein